MNFIEEDSKIIISRLGLNGSSFSKMMGRNHNWVSEFSRSGVPMNIAMMLRLAEEQGELK